MPITARSDNPEEFKALYAYSPLHNVKAGQKYPADAHHDGRPRRSRRAGPLLQVRGDAHAGEGEQGTPVLIRIETKSGHGASNVTKQIESTADIYAFIMYNMGLKPRVGTN